MSSEALQFYKSGRSYLNSHLPFWLADLFGKLIVLLIPILGILYPLIKNVHTLYDWLIRSKVARIYGELKVCTGRPPDARGPPAQGDRIIEPHECRALGDEGKLAAGRAVDCQRISSPSPADRGHSQGGEHQARCRTTGRSGLRACAHIASGERPQAAPAGRRPRSWDQGSIWMESTIAASWAWTSGVVPGKLSARTTTRTPSTSRTQMRHRAFGPWA